MFSCVVFDFDGTLVDSTQSIFEEYVRVAGLMGLRPITYRDFAAQLGKPWDAVLTGLWPDVDIERFNSLYRRELEETPILDGVMDALSELDGEYPLGLLTSRGESSLRTILSVVGVDEGVFDRVFAKESLSVHKPDPAALTEAAEKMGYDVGEIVYVGDSVVDAECAKKAGAFFVGVLSGGTTESDFKSFGVEHVIGSVAGLPELLKKIEDED